MLRRPPPTVAGAGLTETVMPTDHFLRFYPAICAGLGLFLAGGVNLMLSRRGPGLRAAATLLALGVGLAAAAALDHPGLVAGTARFLAVGIVPCLLLGSCRISSVAVWLHRPAVRFGLLTAAGTGLAVGSIVAFEVDDEARL